MARKSRIAGTVETEAPAGKGIYKAGIYARLSNEASGEETLETLVGPPQAVRPASMVTERAAAASFFIRLYFFIVVSSKF